MPRNSINSGVSASGWITASVMIGSVLRNDPKGFSEGIQGSHVAIGTDPLGIQSAVVTRG
jgi:hypothetical protein